jgi:DNA adenine methylase
VGGAEGVMVAASALQAPFPWFGGKATIAPLVWERFGDVPNYVEPFAGSLAVLLARPHAPRTETVNDKDGMIANFWRAVRADPDAVAHHADWPVNENDLHARHAWLVARKDDLAARLEGDPHFYDAQVAGWWVWGVCNWIGSGFCSGRGPWGVVDGKLAHLGDAGRGINRKLAHLGDAGQGEVWSAHLRAMMGALSDRLRRVRVASGDWSRVTGPSVTFRHGLTAVFLDPPYGHQERQADLYTEDHDVAADARAWAIANGDNPLMRIALCGYEGEHAMPAGWSAVPWKARGGFGSQGDGRGRENAAREVVWFSPHCLSPAVAQLVLPLGAA